jgi:transposase
MRPKGSADLLEHRRHRALALLDGGRRSLNEVARLVGSAASSVMRWRDARRRGGVKALKVRFSPGRPRRLTTAQRRSLVRRLLRGAMAYGYQTELWTTGRIADLIEREFAVRYHPDHVGRLLHDLNWSHQKPERRALERNTKAIERWKREHWPRVKKTLRGWGPTSSSPTNRASS